MLGFCPDLTQDRDNGESRVERERPFRLAPGCRCFSTGKQYDAHHQRVWRDAAGTEKIKNKFKAILAARGSLVPDIWLC